MGTDVHVIVADGDARHLVDIARRRIEALERRWSRFLPESELSRLNAAGGRPRVVSADTFELVRRGVAGWRATKGRFDPTVLQAVVASGYDRDFDDLRGAIATAHPARPAPGCGDIGLARTANVVRLPEGIGFDPGGIGKGYAADLVKVDLLERGATGACVNIGGDLRLGGLAPGGEAWSVAVEDPRDDSIATVVHIATGAIATSTSCKRAWQTGDGRRHHLIDPDTGLPADHGLISVTVVAGAAWRAEVLAKAAFVAGADEGAELIVAEGASALFLHADGYFQRVGAIEEYER
jgi:thiamine biosynthesis lipoprotein